MDASSLPFLRFLFGPGAHAGLAALCDDRQERWLRYDALSLQVTELAQIFRPSAPEPAARRLVLCMLSRTSAGVRAYLAACASDSAVFLLDPDVVAARQMQAFVSAYEPDWVVLTSPWRPLGPYAPFSWPLEGLYLWRRVTAPSHALHEDLFLLFPLPTAPAEAVTSARLSYKAVAHNVMASLEALEQGKMVEDKDGGYQLFLDQSARRPPRMLCPLPLASSYGLSLLHMMLSCGGGIFVSERSLKDRQLCTQARARDVDWFAGAPYHYDYLTRAGLENLAWPALKMYLLGGGTLPRARLESLWRQIKARDGAFFTLYGLVEAAPRIACLPVHRFPEKIMSRGLLLRDGQGKFEKDRFCYQGPNVMMGYANSRADLAEGDMQKGVLVVEEKGLFDEDRFLFLGYP
ncbi:MAG: AMP-binding protein [Alphaproteobacteria bacterium]|nr:AMP-binding protein [Alphaproteobacteria bacterium]